MSPHPPTAPPALTLPAEMTDAIILTTVRSIIPTYDDASSMWSICPEQWSTVQRVKFHKFFKLRHVCTNWNERIKDIAELRSFFPLGQMDGDDLQIALHRSKEHLLTVLVNDADSIGLLWPLLRSASHRVRTLYIDVDVSLWPTVSTCLQFHDFNQLENIFIGARGILEDKEEMANFMGMTGGWPTNGLVWAPYGVQSNSGVDVEDDDDDEDNPMSRLPTQASHTRDLARLQNLPVTVLCIRHSSFPFHQFIPPPRLVTLHIHKSHGGHFPFPLDLVHFDQALRHMPLLTVLELWDVHAIQSSAVAPISGSNLRSIALHGAAPSIKRIARYFSLCSLDVFVTELFQNRVGDPAIMDANALAIAQSFTFSNVISSAGICLNVNGSIQWHATIDLVLKTDRNTYMSIRTPAIHAHVFKTILNNCLHLSPNASFSFDMNSSTDPGNMVHHIFLRCIPLPRFHTYHICVHEIYVPTILRFLSTSFLEASHGTVIFHGCHPTWTLSQAPHRPENWIGSVGVAMETVCKSISPARKGRWVADDEKEIFSPAVDLSHPHLMRMLSYDL